ncbi:ABC transporter substrate-binding protein [Albimonas pacifica]|uniref:NitT/TauT family transport system substrate-binding protein n=1 Tax=Albimonas pacifica TaxID=1114924 RepID=A0A1I3E1T4_9RHOB|nr:ABC transporter substrate-binding protein [Albimonas pacifica]SFH92853.1 NitT/TauT family transport system substrate-binding protein [Albimonas pacifica]
MIRFRTLAFVAATLVAAGAAQAQTKIAFANDWKWEGPAAPFLLALDKGYFEEAGLDVTMDTGKGSLDAIPRVAAGTYQMGAADINTLIKFRDQNPDLDVKAIFMIYNQPPFAVVGRKSLGIETPKDLEGKILGAPAPDGAYAQWKAFTKANGIDASKVTIENVGFPVREPMLAQGKVDAITGFSFSSYINLKANGVPEDDITVLLMTENGLDLYGNVVLVNPAFAEENPEAVKAFLAALVKGFKETVADPAAAVKYVTAHNDVAREEVELERLEMAIADNILTDEVKANGFGAVDMERLTKSMDQIADTYDFQSRPTAEAIFDPSFLPPAEERMPD